MRASLNVVRDFAATLNALTNQAAVYTLAPDAALRDALLHGVEACLAMPSWDFMLDGETPIGVQRASLAAERLLFTREALGDAMPPDLDAALHAAIAEKGALPCYRAILGMNAPDETPGWRFDDLHQSRYAADLRRWPALFSENNLRAIPTMGLGIAALALRGRDPRAELWLDAAVSSARRVLGLLSADGSYFEGISYVDYMYRSLFSFLDAHQRLDGSVDWGAQAPFEGVARFILTMQAGTNADGSPDVVNISDSSYGVAPCIPAWIAARTGSGLAQFAALNTSRPSHFLDLLWVEPARPATAPSARLHNVRTDLDWVVCRTGWAPDDAVLAFRSGGPANHEHADRNSLFFKIHGERLLTDLHGAAYDWRLPTWLLRLTEAHNAVLVDGRGHQYHNGEEGTNAGLARAEIVRYEDHGDRVWWCSDATHGYRLVNPDVARVRRTVIYAKPGTVVLFDEVETTEADSRASVRFFPDNRDGAALVDAHGEGFSIRRPRAWLLATVAARAAAMPAVEVQRLDLDAEHGVFPFAEVSTEGARRHEIVTMLSAYPSDAAEIELSRASTDGDGWLIEAPGLRAHIGWTDGGPLGRIPDVTWS
jgi:hypothetical protein